MTPRRSTNQHPFTILALLTLILGATALSGCGGRVLNQQTNKPRIYPQNVELAQTLDIEIIRHGGQIELVNRTALPYKNASLWLNGEYGAEVDDLPVGQGPTISLSRFINQHGETYPVGWFFEPELSKLLVKADMIIDGKAHPLTVRLGRDWKDR